MDTNNHIPCHHMELNTVDTVFEMLHIFSLAEFNTDPISNCAAYP